MAKVKDKGKKTKEKAEEKTQVEVVESEPRKPSDELKVVITLKGDRAIVGVQAPDCDPIFTPLEGGLPAALSQIPALVKSANAKWDANPKNPKAKMPEPPPAPEPVCRQTTTAPKEKAQPSFF